MERKKKLSGSENRKRRLAQEAASKKYGKIQSFFDKTITPSISGINGKVSPSNSESSMIAVETEADVADIPMQETDTTSSQIITTIDALDLSASEDEMTPEPV